MDVDIESLVHLEKLFVITGLAYLFSLTSHSRFYDQGYEDGFAHGRIHGLIEGRALGREKGYEMFEELGFYEGFALTWKKIYESTGRSDEFVYSSSRLSQGCADLLSWASRAIHNIRVLLNTIAQFPRVNPSPSRTSLESDPFAEVDIPRLFRQIRARYKALCATLGVRPSLRATGKDAQGDGNDEEPMKMEPGAKPKTIWEMDSIGKRATGPQQLSF